MGWPIVLQVQADDFQMPRAPCTYSVYQNHAKLTFELIFILILLASHQINAGASSTCLQRATSLVTSPFQRLSEQYCIQYAYGSIRVNPDSTTIPSCTGISIFYKPSSATPGAKQTISNLREGACLPACPSTPPTRRVGHRRPLFRRGSPTAAVWVGRGAVAAPREVGWRAEEPVHGGAYLDQNSREGPVRTLATTT